MKSAIAPTDLVRGSVDFSPKRRGGLLRGFAEFQTELFRIEAGFLPGVSRWELKRELAALVFRDARRVQDLYVRCRELGSGFQATHVSKAVPGRELLEQLCHARDAAAAFHAIFGVVKPRLRAILHASLQDELRVFDAPSILVVQENLAELDRQLEWARRQLEHTAPEPSEWLGKVTDLAADLGTTLTKERSVSSKPTRLRRRIGTLPIMRSAIPEGFTETGTVAGSSDPQISDYAQRALYHAHNFLMEIQASESCASLLFESPDMPWEFYLDVARHMWDEMRHCEFGEIKLIALGYDIRKLGLSNTAYVLRQTIDPLDRYVALTTQEADAFPGKHAGLKDAIEHGDELFARAWSYDIADETQHVRYGHKWIPVMIEATGDPRSYDQLKRDAENWRRHVLGAVYSPAARAFAASGISA